MAGYNHAARPIGFFKDDLLAHPNHVTSAASQQPLGQAIELVSHYGAYAVAA